MWKPLSRIGKSGRLIALLTVGTAALFKISAFAREAFIASRFGLSSFTDAYFAFQQFPLILATFMFGAFGLAFTPAYARERRRTGQVAWLPGLVTYGGILGVLLTSAVIALAPGLLRLFSISAPSGLGERTILILSCSFAPVVWLGIWAGITIADGKNLRAMFVTGLPYLLMTGVLGGLYALGKLDSLSLPISFLLGFGIVGVLTFLMLVIRNSPSGYFKAAVETWKMAGFRAFLEQLGASSVENLGYSCNQLLLVYFVAHAGTGAVSANTCAMRIGMIGFTLLGQPLAQLLQAKLCSAEECEQQAVLKRWLTPMAGAILSFAALLFILRVPIARIVYLHGNFSVVELRRVAEVVPSWAGYFVVASMNAIAARYLFQTGQGTGYVRRQLCAYSAANLVRFALWGNLGAAGVVWCSVAAEGFALCVSLQRCLRDAATFPEPIGAALAGAQHV